MNSLPIQGKDFWSKVFDEIKAGGGIAHLNDGDLQYVAMTIRARMAVIRRTKEELFSKTLDDAVADNKYRVAVNGSLYDVTSSGVTDALFGHDPVEASETTPVGHVYINGMKVDGRDSIAFYIAFEPTKPIADSYTFGGPKTQTPSCVAGLGGMNPLIINGLPYGTKNRYSSGVPAGAPNAGEPPAKYKPFLIQRSNNGYVQAAAKGDRTGKIAISISSSEKRILILTQPDGAPTGISVDSLRDKLVAVGVNNAIMLDGSDSVILNIGGTWHITQGENKEETCTIGLGFKYDRKVYIFRDDKYVRYDIDKNESDWSESSIAGNWPGMPAEFAKGIDAAVNWGNGKVYFFSGDKYVRYDQWDDRVDRGPLPIKGNWKKMPESFTTGIDSAVNWGDGNVYLTKGPQYVRFNIGKDEVDRGPVPIKGNWPGVPAAFELGFDSMVDYGNGYVYITRGSQYVGFKKSANTVTDGPKEIKGEWKKVSTRFHAGFDAMVEWGELISI